MFEPDISGAAPVGFGLQYSSSLCLRELCGTVFAKSVDNDQFRRRECLVDNGTEAFSQGPFRIERRYDNGDLGQQIGTRSDSVLTV